MKTAYIDVDGYWGVVVNYDYDLMDYDDLWAIMRSFGLNDRSSKRALQILSSYNTGMAVSKQDIQMSAIFISNATNASEFWSTVIHEFIHVADAILEYYGESWSGEPAAYLVGYLVKEFCKKVGFPCER